MISPKMTMESVAPMTATMPPPPVSVSRVYYLGNDLAKDDNREGGPDDGHDAPTPGERVQGDGEGVVHQHVPQQDGAEQEVTHPTDRHDGLRKKN